MIPAGLTRWPIWRRWFGTRAERAAGRHLRKLGYRILARNVNLSVGELDLIVLDGEVIAFVEVRSTSGTDLARPAESVDETKQKKVAEAALVWLHRHRLMGRPVRFDVVAVSWPPGAKHPTIAHYPGAFSPPGRFQFFA
ncbi:MAG: YraN family protein [Gemmataceae bacterium]|nr:YraN family protein [Gemmataceae bacterium]